MKKLYFGLLLLVSTFVIMSCGKEETQEENKDKGTFNVNIKLQYAGAPLLMLNTYKTPDSIDLLFNRFSFLMSNIRLGGNEIVKDDVRMLNFTAQNSSITTALRGLDVKFEDVPAGNYSAFAFCVGVPSALNMKDPSAFSVSSPLSEQAEYWSGWKSYIFSRSEGFADLAKTGKLDKGFSLHTGADDALRCLAVNTGVFITKNSITNLELTIDLQKLFGKVGPYYDLKNNPNIHSLSQAAQVKTLADNLSGAFTVIK